jgi:hypothetical protein
MPSVTMRRIIFSTTILILAINGIVSACPLEISVEDHSTHQTHSNASTDDRSDFCDNYDEISAK